MENINAENSVMVKSETRWKMEAIMSSQKNCASTTSYYQNHWDDIFWTTRETLS